MVRRVVTGHQNGRSGIISDEEHDGIRLRSIPGQSVIELWSTGAGFSHPAPVQHMSSNGRLPGPGGTQFLIITIPPASIFAAPDFDRAAAKRELNSLFPGFADDPDHPGMHATASVDYVIILEGSVTLILEDGVEVVLHQGDVLIQCGAMHGWRNAGDEPVTMAVLLVGATTDSELSPR